MHLHTRSSLREPEQNNNYPRIDVPFELLRSKRMGSLTAGLNPRFLRSHTTYYSHAHRVTSINGITRVRAVCTGPPENKGSFIISFFQQKNASLPTTHPSSAESFSYYAPQSIPLARAHRQFFTRVQVICHTLYLPSLSIRPTASKRTPRI